MLTLADALEVLKELWDIPQVAPTASGRYKFVLADDLSFEIQPQGTQEVILFSAISEPYSDQVPTQAELAQWLQYAGARMKFDCGNLAWDRQQAQLIWCIKLKWAEINKTDWLQIIEKFLNSLEFWIKVGKNKQSSRTPAVPFVIRP